MAVALLAGLAVSASCSGGAKKTVPTTTAPPPAPTTTAPVILVPGNPRVTSTLPAEIEGGEATLVGSVVGPGGAPVDGATVHVERLLGDAVTGANAETLPGGRWQMIGIRGGRYRVRAWKAPDLAQLEPAVLFLGATESKEVPLMVTTFGQYGVVGSVEPSPPRVGQAANVLVQVSTATVSGDGIVRSTPRSGVAVQLVVTGNLSLQATPSQTTDANGAAAWKAACTGAGPYTATASVATAVTPLPLPPCAAAPAPPPPTTPA